MGTGQRLTRPLRAARLGYQVDEAPLAVGDMPPSFLWYFLAVPDPQHVAVHPHLDAVNLRVRLVRHEPPQVFVPLEPIHRIVDTPSAFLALWFAVPEPEPRRRQVDLFHDLLQDALLLIHRQLRLGVPLAENSFVYVPGLFPVPADNTVLLALQLFDAVHNVSSWDLGLANLREQCREDGYDGRVEIQMACDQPVNELPVEQRVVHSDEGMRKAGRALPMVVVVSGRFTSHENFQAGEYISQATILLPTKGCVDGAHDESSVLLTPSDLRATSSHGCCLCMETVKYDNNVCVGKQSKLFVRLESN